jgi:hypothetical protein
MTDLKARITEIEAQAAEFELIARLAVVPDVRIRNSELAEVLREEAAQLKAKQALPKAEGPEGVSHA